MMIIIATRLTRGRGIPISTCSLETGASQGIMIVVMVQRGRGKNSHKSTEHPEDGLEIGEVALEQVGNVEMLKMQRGRKMEGVGTIPRYLNLGGTKLVQRYREHDLHHNDTEIFLW